MNKLVIFIVSIFAFTIFPAISVALTANIGDIYPESAYRTVGIDIHFDGSKSTPSSKDKKDAITKYSWDFGDDAIYKKEGPSPFATHKYVAPGIYTVTLTVYDKTPSSISSSIEIWILPAPPSGPITPENGASAITLEADGVFTFKWQSSAGATEYRYQYWETANEIPEPGQNERAIAAPPLPDQPQDQLLGIDISPVIKADITPGVKYSWRARSCADIDKNGTIIPLAECGPYSSLWSFEYLLAPPPLTSFVPTQDKINVAIPVHLEWGAVIGAKSYKLNGGAFCPLPLLAAMEESKKNCSTEACIKNINQQKEDCGIFKTPNTFYDNKDLCSMNIWGKDYGWTVKSCLDNQGELCGPAQKSNFTTATTQPPQPQLEMPTLKSPAMILYPGDIDATPPLVSPDSTLSWNGPLCASTYEIHITRNSDGKKTVIDDVVFDAESPTPSEKQKQFTSLTAKESKKYGDFWNDSLNYGKVFSWSVIPCWELSGPTSGCVGQPESTTWKFQTPELSVADLKGESLRSGELTLSWKGSAFVKSYKYEVHGAGGAIKESTTASSVTLLYPAIQAGATYSWRVVPCADQKAKHCMKDWVNGNDVTTPGLVAPTTFQPPIGGMLSIGSALSWLSNTNILAPFYKTMAVYTSISPDEKNVAQCEKLLNLAVVQPTVSKNPTLNINTNCAGVYTTKVDACLDKAGFKCAEGTLNEFSFVRPTTTDPPDFIPCAKKLDSKQTLEYETDPCQLKHLALATQNILDFVLWKLALLVFAGLATLVAGIAFFSFGNADVISKAKSIFRAYFIGFTILIFSWGIVNVAVGLLGYQVEFFGRWYTLPF